MVHSEIEIKEKLIKKTGLFAAELGYACGEICKGSDDRHWCKDILNIMQKASEFSHKYSER